jgi:hypothetical protein
MDNQRVDAEDIKNSFERFSMDVFNDLKNNENKLSKATRTLKYNMDIHNYTMDVLIKPKRITKKK